MPPCNCHLPFPRPEPFSPLPRPGKTPDWGKWIRDRLAEKGALLVFPTRASFPGAGEWPNLYLDLETGAVYRWDRADYAVLFDPREGNDVLVYDSVAAFPDEGEQGKLYIAANTGGLYRWGGEGYVALLEGKADKVPGAAEGNFAGLDGHGNPTDSGKKPADYEFESGASGKVSDPWTCTPAATQYGTPFSVKWTTDPAEGEGWALFAGDTKQGKVLGNEGSTELSWSPGAQTSGYTVSAVRQLSGTEYHLKGQPDAKLQPAGDYASGRAVKTVNDKVTAVEDKIPPQASASNQLADKAFVNSSIATETATFRGTFNLVTDLQLPLDATHEQVAAAVKTELGQAAYDKNDYVFVQIPQDLEHTDAMKQVDRYKCVETGTDPVVKNWVYEWTLNNSSFTAAQWAAINSGITSGAVAKLGALPTAAELAQALAGKLDASDGESSRLMLLGGVYGGYQYGIRVLTSSGADIQIELCRRQTSGSTTWTTVGTQTLQKTTGTVALQEDIHINGITVNGALRPATNKIVDIPVPIASTSTPQMDGTGAAGSSASGFACGDHRHPSDTSKADKSEVAPLQFAAWYPDGSVTSEADFTQGIKFSYDASTLTASVLPFCNTGDPDADNSRLSGRVVIPPYVEHEGSRYTVTSVSGTPSSPGVGPGPAAVVAPTTVERLDAGALFGCRSLVSASFPGVTTVAGSVFYGCESLVSVSLPVAETVGHAAFNGCSSLKYLALPGATDIKTALGNAGAIESISLPSITRVEAGAFSGDRNLEAVDFGGTPRSSVPPLGSGAFYNVPTTCKIVVPDAQYDAWTAASGWSSLVTQGYTFLKHSEWEPPHRYELDRAKLVYAECATDQGVAAKAATTPGGDFVAEEGRVAVVHFARFCAGGDPTLSIDGSTPLPIYQKLEESGTKYHAGLFAWGNGDVVQLRLFSWGWLILGPVLADPNQLGVARLRNGLDDDDPLAAVNQRVLKAAFDKKLDSSATGFVEFDATRTYVAGATVTYKGHAYICTTNRAPGAWNPAHFDEMPVVVNRTAATGGVAVGEGAKATNDGTAAGRGAEANATGSVATGASAFVSNTSDKGVAVGPDAKVYDQHGTAVGHGAEVSTEKGTAVGYNAKVAAGKTGAIQLGAGTNQQAYSLQFRSTTVVNTDGKIPAANLDNSFTIAGDAAYKTWEISGGTGDDGHGGDNQAIYSRGTYTYDAASGTWVHGANRLIRRKAGTANTFQLVADPGASNEGVMKEFDGFGSHSVDLDYAGYTSTGVSIASSAKDTLARDSDVKNNAGAIEYLRHVFSGQTLPQNPTQNQVAEVVKTIFAQLGGTIV